MESLWGGNSLAKVGPQKMKPAVAVARRVSLLSCRGDQGLSFASVSPDLTSEFSICCLSQIVGSNRRWSHVSYAPSLTSGCQDHLPQNQL